MIWSDFHWGVLFTLHGITVISLGKWRELYHHTFADLSTDELEHVAQRLRDKNPKTALLRPVIEEIWHAITEEDNWQPFYELLKRIQNKI
jgi:uncharacterized protein YdiU (UPF0061 family)